MDLISKGIILALVGTALFTTIFIGVWRLWFVLSRAVIGDDERAED